MDPDRAEFLKQCQLTAEHMAQATEALVFRMLTEGGVSADTISPTVGMGILVGPAHVITLAKAYALRTTGMTTQPQKIAMRTQPQRRVLDDEPGGTCSN